MQGVSRHGSLNTYLGYMDAHKDDQRKIATRTMHHDSCTCAGVGNSIDDIVHVHATPTIK